MRILIRLACEEPVSFAVLIVLALIMINMAVLDLRSFRRKAR